MKVLGNCGVSRLQEKQIELPNLQEMIDLYRTCMRLRRDGEILLQEANRLKRLALNSEIFAVQAGVKGRVFQSLSKETNQLSHDITGVVQQLLGSVESISAKAIECAGRARLCEKYQQALSIGVTSPTREDISERQEVIGDAIMRALGSVFSALVNSNRMINDMEHLHHRLPVIATLMKIEANRDSDFRDTFTANAIDLLSLNQELKRVIISVHGITTDALNRIKQMGVGVYQ